MLSKHPFHLISRFTVGVCEQIWGNGAFSLSSFPWLCCTLKNSSALKVLHGLMENYVVMLPFQMTQHLLI